MNTLITISALGIAAMLAEIFKVRKMIPYLVYCGLALGLFFCYQDWNTNTAYFNNMMVFDNYALAFTGVIFGIAILWFCMSGNFFNSLSSYSDHYAIVLFTITGAVVLTGFSNLTLLFIGIEIVSISLYVLAASNKSNLKSNEAGLKYFLLGSFSTGFLLLGIALVYGATASFDLATIATYVQTNSASLPLIFNVGVLLILCGLLFKVSAVPFHFWTADVYDGAPTPVTAFMATIVKTAGFAAFFRLFTQCFITISPTWSTIVIWVSAATMLLGNILAVYQPNFKRMLAYSSIAHAGYMLMAVLAGSKTGSQALLLYTASYGIASLGAFAFLNRISDKTKTGSIDSFKGLASSSPTMALFMTFVLLSLAGIPPMVGFFAKYIMFFAAIEQGYLPLVVVAVISSLIGVYYYLKVVISFYQTSGHEVQFEFTSSKIVFLGIIVIMILGLGIFPAMITSLF